MSIEITLNEIEDLFDIFDDPKDKLSQLMDIAKDYDGIPEDQRTDQSKIPGCTSQAGAATTSTTSLPGRILWRGPVGRYTQKNGAFAWVWACCRVSTSLWEAWGLPS